MAEIDHARAKRFWKHVSRDDASGCWLWQSTLTRGYGVFWDGVRQVRAHRYAYEHEVGPIPSGLQLDHLCRTRNCVNPAHLGAVTSRENTLRGVSPPAQNDGKTHCKRGHPFTSDNIARDQFNDRSCKTCRVEANRLWRQRVRERRAMSGATHD